MMRRKRTQSLRDRALGWLAALLLAAGAVVLLYPALSNRYYQRQCAQAAETFAQGQSEAENAALWQAAEAYNMALAEKAEQFALTAEEREQIAACLNPLGTGMMGSIEIPKIDVNLPIYQGTEEQQLQSGCGWWPGTSLPTGGSGTHCVITAHTGLTKAKLFTDLDRLETGDRFTLHILDRDMNYEVDQILVTEPEELAPLRIVPGEDLVSLYTCTPYGVNSHRLLVRGHRVEAEEADTERSFAWWSIPVAAVFPILWLLRRIKRQK